MVYFQTKNPNLGKFWRALDRKILIYFIAICYILRTFAIFCDQWVHFAFIRYIFFSVLVSRTKENLATLKWIPNLHMDATTNHVHMYVGAHLMQVFVSDYLASNRISRST
jgi:hypothetical protein